MLCEQQKKQSTIWLSLCGISVPSDQHLNRAPLAKCDRQPSIHSCAACCATKNSTAYATHPVQYFFLYKDEAKLLSGSNRINWTKLKEEIHKSNWLMMVSIFFWGYQATLSALCELIPQIITKWNPPYKLARCTVQDRFLTSFRKSAKRPTRCTKVRRPTRS